MSDIELRCVRDARNDGIMYLPGSDNARLPAGLQVNDVIIHSESYTNTPSLWSMPSID